ncbi:MAG: methyltransferase domain-containing protein [Phaeodactylibacter sp.]|nr:methyltransferase domain-containing protein [Phaeodactylibacter sp.]
METQNSPKKYYDQLAASYDRDRFGNSYGQYLHQQEQAFMQSCFSIAPADPVLSLACGTGRFMEYATHGLDIAPGMLEVAQGKFPDKQFVLGSALDLPFKSGQFGALFTLHFLMHLSKSETSRFLSEAYRVLKPRGRLVLDFPSERRRQLVGHQQSGWHGANAYSLAAWTEICGDRWHIRKKRGLLFFPIHRLPVAWRAPFRPVDNLLGRSPLQEYASYLILEMIKR